MKKLLLASIVAVSALAVAAMPAQAKGHFCEKFPAHPHCVGGGPGDPPPPPPFPGGGHPPPHPWPHPHHDFGDGFFFDNGFGYPFHHYSGIYFNLQTGPDYYTNQCSAIARSLARYGYRHVKAVSCGGRYNVYSATRHGDAVLLTVSRSSGRVVKIRPLY